MAGPYDEFKHPRGYAGKFTGKPASSKKKKKRKAFAHLAVPSKQAVLKSMQGKSGKTTKVGKGSPSY